MIRCARCAYRTALALVASRDPSLGDSIDHHHHHQVITSFGGSAPAWGTASVQACIRHRSLLFVCHTCVLGNTPTLPAFCAAGHSECSPLAAWEHRPPLSRPGCTADCFFHCTAFTDIPGSPRWSGTRGALLLSTEPPLRMTIE